MTAWGGGKMLLTDKEDFIYKIPLLHLHFKCQTKSIRLRKYWHVPFVVTNRKTMLQAIVQLQQGM